MRTDRHVTVHKNDLWNAPDWALEAGVSVKITGAARMLGIGRTKLNYKADELGLTVLRGPHKVRYFLRSEIEALLGDGRKVDADTIRRAMKGRYNATETTLEGMGRQKGRAGKTLKD